MIVESAWTAAHFVFSKDGQCSSHSGTYKYGNEPCRRREDMLLMMNLVVRDRWVRSLKMTSSPIAYGFHSNDKANNLRCLPDTAR